MKKQLLIGGLLGVILAFGTLSSFRTSTPAAPQPLFVADGSSWTLYKVIDGSNVIYICQGDKGQISISR
jgi:hypothetical protein